jgi:hypothetical protein
MGKLSHNFCRRTYDTEHSTIGGITRQIVLLNGTEGLGGGGVAPKNDQRASQREELLDCLKGELVHHVEGACAVGGTRIVTEVYVIILRHALAYAVKYG